MSDTRIEKLEAHWGNWRQTSAAKMISQCEAAGLLVIDANDPATVERAGRAVMDAHLRSTEAWFVARAVLAALAMPQDRIEPDPYPIHPLTAEGRSHRKGREFSTGRVICCEDNATWPCPAVFMANRPAMPRDGAQ